MTRLDRRKFLAASASLAAGAAFGQDRRSAQPSANGSSLVSGNTAFGFDLYGQLRTDAGNLFLSPFSISTALAMTAAGAKGKTLEEMKKVLHLPDQASGGFGAILGSLNDAAEARKGGFTLTTANALWAQKGYPWRPEYRKLVTTDYHAGLFNVDFISAPDESRGTINAWVEKETREKIKDLLPQGSVTRDTRLVLTNAIYFKGAWLDQFKKQATKDLPFTTTGGKTVEAPLMFRTGGYNYAETDTFQVLDLPYAGRRISMTVFLPRKPDGLPTLEKELTADKLAEALKGLSMERQVHVYLPRFKTEKEFSLQKPLESLGMRAAFHDADFSGMHTGQEQLAISAVVHKAFVDVNEEGTEAAAATGVVVGLTSAPAPSKPKTFRADHPFLFLIRDHKTGSVLFLGRVENPRA